jgi:catechol 2,3-dioxygenase-like lactoylglutathione lyase family enzyme
VEEIEVKITGVLHASVNVSGTLDAASEWYRQVLGLETTWRPHIDGVPGAWFAIDDVVQMHLVGSPPRADRPIDPGAHHVCLGVEDLEAAVAELDAGEIPYVRGEQNHNGVVVPQIFVTDPAGNVIELQEDTRL